METITKQFRIASIHFDNTATKVLIKGETINKHLSYRSEMFVNFSYLNSIMNILLKNNPDLDLEILTSREEYGAYMATTINTDTLDNTVINIDNSQPKHSFVQIRA